GEIDARAAWLYLAAYSRWNSAPRTFDLGEIFGDRADRAVLLNQLGDKVVERLKHVLVNADVPVPVGHNVVAGTGLRLRSRGELRPLALPGHVIDFGLAIGLRAPHCRAWSRC